MSLTVVGRAARQRARDADDACDVRMIAWIADRAHRNAKAGRHGFGPVQSLWMPHPATGSHAGLR
ncbi:hypothetical protein [Burkholderia cenocepacia]|uniref:hypothetical protein n=1 Tax=Burkholderia cenocepacia TaxID=95486 RepID=UPI002AB058A5|nr:hypothetical protein [Burkholderia cenocepacia]